MKKCIFLAYDKDDPSILTCQTANKWDIEVVFDNTDIIKVLKKESKDFILFDLEAGGKFPTEILTQIRKSFPDIHIFILSHSKNEDLRQDFLKYNISDFFEIPKDFDSIVQKIEKTYYKTTFPDDNLYAKEKELSYLKNKYPILIGNSPVIYNLKEFIDKSSQLNFPILLTGETGTGKNMVAKIIHTNSNFKDGKFVSVNVSCIPENLAEAILFGSEKGSFTDAQNKDGLFLTANGGTIFLDEIEELSLGIQAKLLTVIETKQVRPVGSTKTKKVDFRLICATNTDLKKLIKENRFREDLYYRLDVLHHTILPLRKRKEDISILIDSYLKGKEKDISETAIEKLLLHDWPGNVRELFNCLDRAYCNAFYRPTIESYDIEF